MKFETIPCHDSLCPFIRNYWLLTSRCTASDSTQHIYSNGAASLHFYLTQDVIIDKEPQPYSTSLNRHDIGCMDLHCEVGDMNILGVEFVPFCARLFFPTLTNEVAHLRPSASGDLAFIELDRKIHANQNKEELVILLDNFFCQRLREIPIDERNIERLSSVFSEIVPTEGEPTAIKDFESLSPSDLATTACIGQKQFTRIFNKYVGMVPKTYLRLLRFNKAMMELQKSAGKNSLSEIAWQCGYCDLAHMANDFHQLCGHSPSEILEFGAKMTEAFSPNYSSQMKKKVMLENLE